MIALCKLERGGTNVSQPVFAAPCFPILSQVRHLSTLLPATSFFHLFSFLNKSEYGGWEERRRIIWAHVWTVKKYLKSMDSPIVVCLLRPPQALSQPPKLFAKFSTFSSRVISGREIMDRIRAPRNHDGDSFLCMCCSRLCLLWARPNFVRLTFERDIKMWLIEFWGNGHRKRWEWVRYCCQRRYHTLQIELDTKITQQEINSPKRGQFYNTRLFMPVCNERVDEALYEHQPRYIQYCWFPCQWTE